jgi:3-deoxy-D-manno-octulosonate 8-phosphate phosphatase (KDO 8-P phosphatase)
MEAGQEVLERASKISLVLMDVDGVLTDGRILMYSDGTEGRAFCIQDGHGIRMGQRGGLMFGILSGRESRVVTDRAEELYITEVHQGLFDKIQRYEEILERFQIPSEAVCYIGDDLVDVPVMRRVGLAVAPADAEDGAKDAAHWVTRRRGGEGAVRDLVDLILRAKGKWAAVTERYFKEG